MPEQKKIQMVSNLLYFQKKIKNMSVLWEKTDCTEFGFFCTCAIRYRMPIDKINDLHAIKWKCDWPYWISRNCIACVDLWILSVSEKKKKKIDTHWRHTTGLANVIWSLVLLVNSQFWLDIMDICRFPNHHHKALFTFSFNKFISIVNLCQQK